MSVRSHVQHLATVVYRVSPTLQRLRRVRRELLPPLLVLVSRTRRKHRRRCDDIAGKRCVVLQRLLLLNLAHGVLESIARGSRIGSVGDREIQTRPLLNALVSLAVFILR